MNHLLDSLKRRVDKNVFQQQQHHYYGPDFKQPVNNLYRVSRCQQTSYFESYVHGKGRNGCLRNAHFDRTEVTVSS